MSATKVPRSGDIDESGRETARQIHKGFRAAVFPATSLRSAKMGSGVSPLSRYRAAPFGGCSPFPICETRSLPNAKIELGNLRSVLTLANILTESGLSWDEGTVYIVGMRLKYLGAFSISNLEQVFQVRK